MKRETTFHDIFDAQKCYRLILDSMARPGKINRFYPIDLQPPAGIYNASVLVAFSLLNADVTFDYVGENGSEVSKYLLLNTSSSPTNIDKADFIFMNSIADCSAIVNAKRGTLPYPEEGSTLVLDVNLISKTPIEDSLRLTLKGPGVNGETILYVDGLQEVLLLRMLEINDEFPLGMDMIFADRQNQIACLPRSTQFSWTSNNKN